MQRLVERVLNVALTVSAVSIAGLLIRRELTPTAIPTLDQGPLRVATLREWPEATRLGQLSGSPAATLHIVVLSDLECPGCRQFHALIRSLQREDSLAVALRVLPFSLPQHRFAHPASRLLECARRAGHFDAMLDALFAGQDSLGLKAWAQFAASAGWHAGDAAEVCARDTAGVSTLDEAKAFGERIALRATPTVLVNGFRLDRVPTRAELIDARDRVRAGHPPFSEMDGH